MIQRIFVAAMGFAAILAAPAVASDVAYMTGATNPYGLAPGDPGSPELHMIQLHGSYDRFQGYDNDIFTMGYAGIHIEVSGDQAAEFMGVFSSAAATSYVAHGGRLWVNAAIAPAQPFELAFGVKVVAGTSVEASIPGIVMHENGAGTFWQATGAEPMSPGYLDWSQTPLLQGGEVVMGDGGPLYQWFFDYNYRYMFMSALTPPAFQSAGADILRRNISCQWMGGDPALCGNIVAPIPEPSSWVMMIAGFGLMGVALRRARPVQLPA